MRHKKELIELGDRPCTVLTEPDGNTDILLIQPTDSHDREELDVEAEWIETHSSKRFTLVAVHINKWFDELAPWPAPPVFGKTPFGDGASSTLRYITNTILPHFPSQLTYLGGYSLAGLFALWAGCQYGFNGIVAASPSVWYRDWIAYAGQHPSMTRKVYLSLGDRETHSKTKIMAQVGECLDQELSILKSQGLDAIKEINPGNHFQDNGIRTAKGFVWCME